MGQGMFSGLNHYGIYCRDLEETIAFYRDCLDFEFLNYFEDRNGDEYFNMAFMRLGAFILEISESPSWDEEIYEWACAGPNHFCFVCGDLEAMKEKLGAKFRAAWDAVRESPDYRSVLLRGPSGERIELMQIITDLYPAVYAPSDTPYVRGFGHVSYYCEDLEESLKFYTDILGFDHVATLDMDGLGTSFKSRTAILKLGDIVLELALPIANPVIVERIKHLASLSMDHLGLSCTGDMQEAIDFIRSKSDLVWEDTKPAISHNVVFGNDMQWVLLRGPNGERLEPSKDIIRQTASARD